MICHLNSHHVTYMINRRLTIFVLHDLPVEEYMSSVYKVMCMCSMTYCKSALMSRAIKFNVVSNSLYKPNDNGGSHKIMQSLHVYNNNKISIPFLACTVT